MRVFRDEALRDQRHAEMDDVAGQQQPGPHRDIDAEFKATHPAREHDLRSKDYARAAHADCERHAGHALGGAVFVRKPSPRAVGKTRARRSQVSDVGYGHREYASAQSSNERYAHCMLIVQARRAPENVPPGAFRDAKLDVTLLENTMLLARRHFPACRSRRYGASGFPSVGAGASLSIAAGARHRSVRAGRPDRRGHASCCKDAVKGGWGSDMSRTRQGRAATSAPAGRPNHKPGQVIRSCSWMASGSLPIRRWPQQGPL